MGNQKMSEQGSKAQEMNEQGSKAQEMSEQRVKDQEMSEQEMNRQDRTVQNPFLESDTGDMAQASIQAQAEQASIQAQAEQASIQAQAEQAWRREMEEYAPNRQIMLKQSGYFLFGSIVYGILFTLSFYKGFHGITVPMISLVTILGLWGAMRIYDEAFQKKHIPYLIAWILLGISSCKTMDSTILFFNICGILLLALSFLLELFCETEEWGFQKYLAEILKAMFAPLTKCGTWFTGVRLHFQKQQREKNSKTGYVWIGIVIAIPFLLVIIALMCSADRVFSHMMETVFKNMTLPERPLYMLFLLWVGIIGSYGLLSYFADECVSDELIEKEKWEPVIGITFLSMLTVLYLIFSMIQICYLFLGSFALPEGYSYSAYAREGFFQLLALCVLNLLIILVCNSRFGESKILKILLTVFSACTYIMVASSMMRMTLYVKAYDLSYLRLLTYWALVVIGILLIGCLLQIWNQNFPLFRFATVVVTVCYLSLSLVRPDTVIASYNLHHAGEEKVDIQYLISLGPDAIPVLLESEQGAEIADYYDDSLQRIMNQYEEMGILDYNFSLRCAGKCMAESVMHDR